MVETPDCSADASAAGLTDDEPTAIVDRLGKDPEAGDETKGAGGARKVRLAGRGKGGGYRVITFYSGQDVPVFLLKVFFKGERVDFTQAERNALKAELAGLVKDYKKGARRHVRSG